MNGVAQAADDAGEDELSSASENLDFGFLPQNLINQCRRLIESYHGLHGYGSLPDILWRAGLGPFIETHRELRQILRKASTTRSAKKSNDGFAQIATTLLSLEILASNFAGWSTIHPQATTTAKSILKRHTRFSHTPLMESYLYPPKYVSSAAIATLALPTKHEVTEPDFLRAQSAGQIGGNPPMAAMPVPS
jgi:hypothetical protein